MPTNTGLKNRRLLIVDDEPDLLSILAEICKCLTSDITLATNGIEALNIIKSEKIDAVITDINMPKMSGLELLENVRDMGLDTPFIILSGFGDKENTVRALRSGATDFIDKPFDDKKLLSSVDIALNLGVAFREAEAEMDSVYRDSNLSPENLQRLRQAQKTLWTIKKDFEVRHKETTSGQTSNTLKSKKTG